MNEYNNSFDSIISQLGDNGIAERVNEDVIKNGVLQADSIINAVQNIQVERVQGIGDDFIPDTHLYNALGAIYPYLSIEFKNKALRAYLSQLDKVNYYYTQLNHTSKIRDPITLSDILTVRYFYFPGLDEGKEIFRKSSDFNSFREGYMTNDGLFEKDKIDSDFLVAYSAIRTDTSPFSSEYIKACHPGFLKRVVKGIVNILLSYGKEEEQWKKNYKSLKQILPKALHPSIQVNYEQKDWPNAALFRI